MSISGLRSLLVVMDRGFDPVGVVMGAGTFQIFRPLICGIVGMPKRAGEPLVYESYEMALRDAWSAAIDRLQAETVAAGAHGVLGVAVSATWAGGNPSMFQLQLVGTAVRLQGQPTLARPFLTTLAMEDFLKLLVAGWVPSGITWGVTAVHVHGYDASAMFQGAAWTNAELAVPTAAMLLARSRLEEQARDGLARCGAQGAVEVRLDFERRPIGCGAGGDGVVVEGLMLGTGVVRYRAGVARPHMALELLDKGRR